MEFFAVPVDDLNKLEHIEIKTGKIEIDLSAKWEEKPLRATPLL